MEQLNKNAITSQVPGQAPRRKWSAKFKTLLAKDTFNMHIKESLAEVREIYRENKKINGDKSYVHLTREQKSIVAQVSLLAGVISAAFTLPSVFPLSTVMDAATYFSAWALSYLTILVLPATLRRFLNLEKTTEEHESKVAGKNESNGG